MEALEFRAKVENGLIRVPEEYRSRVTESVRVIVLADEPVSTSDNMIARLLETPRRVQDFVPLSRGDIYE
jgi:hypothetical protein